jgi:hypothetical protein
LKEWKLHQVIVLSFAPISINLFCQLQKKMTMSHNLNQPPWTFRHLKSPVQGWLVEMVKLPQTMGVYFLVIQVCEGVVD